MHHLDADEILLTEMVKYLVTEINWCKLRRVCQPFALMLSKTVI